jgi:hypothetical protein
MFVTSDIFDLGTIAATQRYSAFDWRENLLCGVALHGAQWRGYRADAAFFLESAELCGITAEMLYAGYTRPGDKRERQIKPSSFDKLARGALKAAAAAHAVHLFGLRDVAGSRTGTIHFGGESSSRPRQRLGGSSPSELRPFGLEFRFPAAERPLEVAASLLRRAATELGVEYGYQYLRDEYAFPSGYPWGMANLLDPGRRLYDIDSGEIGDWGRYLREGRHWAEGFPLLRDLYQLNLISERHTSVPLPELGCLDQWITAQTGRGSLEDIGNGRLLWTLTDQELFNARPILDQAGALKSCNVRVYRDLPPPANVRPPRGPFEVFQGHAT